MSGDEADVVPVVGSGLPFASWLAEHVGSEGEVGAVAAAVAALDLPARSGRSAVWRSLTEAEAEPELLDALDRVHRLWIEAQPWWKPNRPFEHGNTAAEHHGAYSPRRVEPLATELIELVRGQAALPGSPTAYLQDPTYAPALWAWAKVEAQVQLLEEWLADHGGPVDGEGGVRGAANLWARCEASARKHRQQLGLDPLSRARLGRDVAATQVDVAQLMAELDDGGESS